MPGGRGAPELLRLWRLSWRLCSLRPGRRRAPARRGLCRHPAAARPRRPTQSTSTPARGPYFGDPRAIAHGSRVFTGCVSTTRGIVVHQYDLRTGRDLPRPYLHRNHELDDHDNPSLALWRRRVYAFYSPHSGRVFPLDRHSEMHYRASKRPYDLHQGFGPERHVPTNTPGGLGYTYPNPVPTRDKLWLFWRGGNWAPSFSYTRDGVHWVKARTLVRGPHASVRTRSTSAARTGRSTCLLRGPSDVLPHEPLLRALQGGRASTAPTAGSSARMRDLPLRTSQLDRVYRFRPSGAAPGRTTSRWSGRHAPRIAYTAREGGPGGIDTFYLARWDGARWRSYRIVSAGRGALTFNSGGITFDHAQPSRVVLSRTIGDWNEVELWRTPDGGRSWLTPIPVTSDSDAHNFRPTIPRNLTGTSSLVVFYVHGTATASAASGPSSACT